MLRFAAGQLVPSQLAKLARRFMRHSSVIVRAANQRDVTACIALAAKASGHPAREWRDRVREDLARADRLLLVAHAGSRMIGYARARCFTPERAAAPNVAPAGHYLLGLFVEPRFRRRGVASALTEMRLAWIRERSSCAWFFTNAGNAASIALHARFGFVEVTRDFSFPHVTFTGGVGVLYRVDFARS